VLKHFGSWPQACADAARAHLSGRGFRARARFRKALQSRDAADPAVAPLVEAHAARLEQLDDRWPLDPEAQARMLRAAQSAVRLDAVTIGAGGRLGARVEIARDVCRRLRPVLGERAQSRRAAGGDARLPPIFIRALGAEEPEAFFSLRRRADRSDAREPRRVLRRRAAAARRRRATGLIALAPDVSSAPRRRRTAG